jgi:hypothetical protein
VALALLHVELASPLALLATAVNIMAVVPRAPPIPIPSVEHVLLNAEQICPVQMATPANPTAVVLNAMPILSVETASLHVESMTLVRLALPADPMAQH